MKTIIYGLVCPLEGEIKYIGKTKGDPDARLRQHINVAHKKKHLGGKNLWIRSLHKEGHVPLVKILEECEGDSWLEREKYWIKYFSEGMFLFNVTPGGEDFVFRSGNDPWNKGGGGYSEGSRQKMSDSARNRNVTKEQKLLSNAKTSVTLRAMGFRPSEQTRKASNEARRKSVLEYDLDGNFVREWISISEVVRSAGRSDTTTVSACCSGKIKSCMGKLFRYWQEDYPLKIDPPLRKKKIFGPRRPRKKI
jgi:hypothetical protein